jgi:hypothetical protein
MTQPIELRLNRKTQNGVEYYTIDKVWPGVGNVSFGQLKFATVRDATQWVKVEHPKVPLICNPVIRESPDPSTCSYRTLPQIKEACKHCPHLFTCHY